MVPRELPDPTTAGCTRARGRQARFLSGELSRAEQDQLRQHVACCGACRQAFEDAMGLAAHLNRQPRRVRDEAARVERRRRQRARALSGALRLPGGERGARLRLLLLPALAVFLFTGLGRGPRGGAEARLEALTGAVHVHGAPLAVTEPAVALERGQLCSTGPDARGRLTMGAASAELGPSTWVWLESGADARLRLGGGRVLLRGRTTLTSRDGVVEVQGGVARALLGPDGLEVEAVEGVTSVTDSRGVHIVEPGGAVRVAPAGRPERSARPPVPGADQGG